MVLHPPSLRIPKQVKQQAKRIETLLSKFGICAEVRCTSTMMSKKYSCPLFCIHILGLQPLCDLVLKEMALQVPPPTAADHARALAEYNRVMLGTDNTQRQWDASRIPVILDVQYTPRTKLTDDALLHFAIFCKMFSVQSIPEMLAFVEKDPLHPWAQYVQNHKFHNNPKEHPFLNAGWEAILPPFETS